MYLGFYPETLNRQKIAWVGTLLTYGGHIPHPIRSGDALQIPI